MKVGFVVLCNICFKYVQNIGKGVNKLYQNKFVNKNIINEHNFNVFLDKYATAIIGILTLAILLSLIFITIILKKILVKRVYCDCNYYNKNIKFIFSFVFMIILSYCFHQLPYVFKGLSWNFIFMWHNRNVEIVLYEIYVVIWLLYVFFVLLNYYKKCIKI